MEKGFSGRNCLNDFEGTLVKKSKNSLGFREVFFLGTRIPGVIPPKYTRCHQKKSLIFELPGCRIDGGCC
jgi:hypothetical protein